MNDPAPLPLGHHDGVSEALAAAAREFQGRPCPFCRTPFDVTRAACSCGRSRGVIALALVSIYTSHDAVEAIERGPSGTDRGPRGLNLEQRGGAAGG